MVLAPQPTTLWGGRTISTTHATPFPHPAEEIELSVGVAALISGLQGEGDAAKLRRFEYAVGLVIDQLKALDRSKPHTGGLMFDDFDVDFSVVDGRIRIEAIDFMDRGEVSESTISLKKLESEISIKISEMENRRFLIENMTKIFTRGNGYLWVSIGIFTIIDCINLWVFSTPPESRIISSEVLYALVGATVVQLGVIMIAISRHLFPGSTDE